MIRWFVNHKKITVIIIVTAVLIFGFIRRHKKTEKANGDDILKVAVQTIGTSALDEIIPVTGTFEPLISVEIVPEVSGQLQLLRLEDGTQVDVGVVVKEGEVIAVINRDIYQAQFNQAQAALMAAKVAFADAERERDRMVKLYEAGSTTQQARDKALTTADLASAQLKQAQAAFDMTRVTLDKTVIKSPLNGIVARKYVDEGNMVGPNTALVRIVHIDTLKMLGSVSERYLPMLKVNETQVKIKTDAYPKNNFNGTVFKIAVSVDPVTRTGEVEIRVPNEDGRLKPGMFARMTMVVGRKECAVVPDSALIREGDQIFVLVVDNNIALRRNVKLGIWQGDFHEILEGISVGDVVITRGQTLVKDGQQVEIIQEEVK